MLEVKSTVKGALLPRMTQAERNAIANPATSLTIYQTDAVHGYYYNAGTPASPSWLLVGGDLTLPYSRSISSDSAAFKVTNASTAYLSSGIWGVASSVSGSNTYGLKGESYAPDGRGVSGKAWSLTGLNYGVRGTSESESGIGVDGWANSPTGMTIGVRGVSTSSGGIGVFGSSGWMEPNAYSGYFSGERFYVEGKVGIGITNPDFPLVVMTSVAGSTDIADFRDPDNNNMVRIRQSANGSGGIHVYNGLTPNVNTILLYGNGNSYINGGNLGIGTTDPGYKLVVMGSAAKTDGASWTVISDARLKNLEGNYDKGLAEIAALQPVKFFYKAGNTFGLPSDQEQIGFVAQEVQKVFPEAVHQSRDGYLDFNMHPVNVALVNAVKELKAENDRLKAEVKNIKEEMNARIGKIEALMSSRVEK